MSVESIYGEAEKTAESQTGNLNSMPPNSLSETELQQLADNVYRLLCEEVRLECARLGERL